MSNFDYSWTCPDINKEIENFREVVSDKLDDLISELNPMFYSFSAEKIKYRNTWEEDIYKSIESCIENIRDTNTKIRDEADRQIENAIYEAENYKCQLEQLQDEYDNLEKSYQELEDDNNNLEEEFIQLKKESEL